MEHLDTIVLPGRVGLLIVLGCFYVVLRGRQDWAAGLYVASPYAARSIMIGPIVHTWVFLGTMLGAAVVFALRRERYYSLPRSDRWIVVWMALWWCWILVLLWQFDPEVKMSILRYLMLYILAPLPAVLQISRDLRQVRGFAIAFVCVVLADALLALHVAAGSPSTLTGMLAGIGVGYLGFANYHFFSQGLGIGLIFAAVLSTTSRGIFARLGWLAGAALLVPFMFLAGSRQSILGVAVVVLLLVVWMVVTRGSSLVSVLLVASIIALVAVGLYALSPAQILREQPELGGSALSGSVAERASLWAAGIHDFLRSPLWGWGFTRYWSHNLFIAALADQGLAGAVFLGGFLWFLVRRAREVVAARHGGDGYLWQLAFVGVALFGLVHSQISGNSATVWHLYWSAAFLWGLGVRRGPRGRSAPQPRPVAATL